MASSTKAARTKGLVVVVFVVVAVSAAAGAWRAKSRADAREAGPPDVLPAFTEAPDGPRAPEVVMFGVRPGFTTLADVEALVRDRKLACRDTSARALMREARARRAAEGAKREGVKVESAEGAKGEGAKGGDGVDATSGASSKGGWSARETNPQVRLSCEGTSAAALGDRARPAATGRLLFVVDSAAHPLRHVSYRRLHAEDGAALADVASALARVTAALGPPTETSGALPDAAAEAPRFEPYAPFTATWRWADLSVTVRALSYGARGIDVYEAVEVPWPVRSDAPAQDRAAFARGAKQ